MSVLQPYIDKGELVVQSKQMGMDKVATLRWDAATAQTRMENLLSAYYTKKHVDAVLSPYDGLSIGIISALKSVGYGTSDVPMPIISGQDAKSRRSSRSSPTSSIRRSSRTRATSPKSRPTWSTRWSQGGKPEINDTKTYNNKVKIVPSYLLKPVPVDASNWKPVLVDSGYYKIEQLQ